ncbi:MAG: DUF1919 domain-containing protein [Kluyvera sp.]|uniref:DUF1919 domain-containing protein n=1 Tax=Kluyvera sp. TaxID=1538228 RepID=UPI003F3E1995
MGKAEKKQERDVYFSQKIVIKLSSFISKRLDYLLLKNKEFCIISNNCWGNRLYSIVKREYNTPFVGLYLLPDDYIKFINNLESNVSIELKDIHFKSNATNYPIADINGCTIHFLHYKDQSEAIDKWNRRRLRLISHINTHGLNSIIFKLCDINDNSALILKEFDALEFTRKILITRNLSKYFVGKNGEIINGLELFKGRLLYYKMYFSIFRNLPQKGQITRCDTSPST